MRRKTLVAIVDDDQPFRDSMARLLKSLGYSVVVFSSALEFLASREIAATACLVADIQMPEMTGIELHRHLVDTGRGIPTILVTAYPRDSVKARLLALGIEGYFRKPFEKNDLIECLRSAFAHGAGN